MNTTQIQEVGINQIRQRRQSNLKRSATSSESAATSSGALPGPCHAEAGRAFHTSPFTHFGQAGRIVHDQYQHSFAKTNIEWIDRQTLSIARGDLHQADPSTNGQILSVGTVPPS